MKTKKTIAVLFSLIILLSCVGCGDKTYPSEPSIVIVKKTTTCKGGMQRYKAFLPDEENTDMGSLTIFFADSIGKFSPGDTLCFSKIGGGKSR